MAIKPRVHALLLSAILASGCATTPKTVGHKAVKPSSIRSEDVSRSQLRRPEVVFPPEPRGPDYDVGQIFRKGRETIFEIPKSRRADRKVGLMPRRELDTSQLIKFEAILKPFISELGKDLPNFLEKYPDIYFELSDAFRFYIDNVDQSTLMWLKNFKILSPTGARLTKKNPLGHYAYLINPKEFPEALRPAMKIIFKILSDPYCPSALKNISFENLFVILNSEYGRTMLQIMYSRVKGGVSPLPKSF